MPTFLRLFESSAPSSDLASACRERRHPARFDVAADDLGLVPGSPFSYWVSAAIREAFRGSKLERADGPFARIGLSTHDDFRWLRLSWEARAEAGMPPLAKGGAATRFYGDLHLVVDWRNNGRQLQVSKMERHRSGELTANNSRCWNRELYGRPGVTWPRRTSSLAMRVCPGGGVFGDKGPCIFSPIDDLQDLRAIVGLTNSAAFGALVSLQTARTTLAQSFETGLIARTPVPHRSQEQSTNLCALSDRGWSAKRSLDTVVEVSHAFVVPAVLQVAGDSFDERVSAWGDRVGEVEAELVRVQFEIDELCFELYGISEEDRRAITDGFGVTDTDTDDEAVDDADEDESDGGVELDPVGLAAGLVSWAVGVAVGRFDVRLAIGERDWPAEPDPFDPLPVCSAGMLTGDDGLPVVSLPDGYPLVPSPVLVDDPGHELDITTRVRVVFDVVFGDLADSWWSEVGGVLDAKNGVDGWLRRGFFEHHLKTYSKSRRKAPIVWPIGTKSGSYQVWLYAHSVTPDTMFRLLGDVIEPKLAAEQRQLSDLTQEFGPSPTASQRRSLDAQQKLVDEITELRDEIRAIAALWHPDLNDGIVIVLAPLWRLFAQHRAWSKELKDRWVKLAKGDYDWAQLAMHIWPERVIPKCATDRSLAIAHDLEDDFWTQDDTNPDKWHPRTTPTTPIDHLIEARTNPTITTTRNHPNP